MLGISREAVSRTAVKKAGQVAKTDQDREKDWGCVKIMLYFGPSPNLPFQRPLGICSQDQLSIRSDSWFLVQYLVVGLRVVFLALDFYRLETGCHK